MVVADEYPLKDQGYGAGPTCPNYSGMIVRKFKEPLQAQYVDAANTGTITDFSTGALYLLCIQTSGGSTTSTLTFQSRVTATDQ